MKTTGGVSSSLAVLPRRKMPTSPAPAHTEAFSSTCQSRDLSAQSRARKLESVTKINTASPTTKAQRSPRASAAASGTTQIAATTISGNPASSVWSGTRTGTSMETAKAATATRAKAVTAAGGRRPSMVFPVRGGRRRRGPTPRCRR